ncbi:MAG: hypothetical protein AAGG01_22000 [Planctomycetota bacterium]
MNAPVQVPYSTTAANTPSAVPRTGGAPMKNTRLAVTVVVAVFAALYVLATF